MKDLKDNPHTATYRFYLHFTAFSPAVLLCRMDNIEPYHGQVRVAARGIRHVHGLDPRSPIKLH